MLLDLGFRVVAPDMMGYGGTVRYGKYSNVLHDITAVQSSSLSL
jgi:hypothetical protein